MAVATTRDAGEFEIELQSLKFEDDDPFAPDTYRIVFRVEREGRGFEIAVWLLAGTVPTVDLIRAAMALLHAVVARLAEQTAGWRTAPA